MTQAGHDATRTRIQSNGNELRGCEPRFRRSKRTVRPTCPPSLLMRPPLAKSAGAGGKSDSCVECSLAAGCERGCRPVIPSPCVSPTPKRRRNVRTGDSDAAPALSRALRFVARHHLGGQRDCRGMAPGEYRVITASSAYGRHGFRMKPWQPHASERAAGR